jgi:hypothetical protein
MRGRTKPNSRVGCRQADVGRSVPMLRVICFDGDIDRCILDEELERARHVKEPTNRRVLRADYEVLST